jgi:hypothetical protein
VQPKPDDDPDTCISIAAVNWAAELGSRERRFRDVASARAAAARTGLAGRPVSAAWTTAYGSPGTFLISARSLR